MLPRQAANKLRKMMQETQPKPRIMMAVAQYPFPVVGGLEKQAHELAKALQNNGLNVQVISGLFATGQAKRDWVEDVSVSRIPWSQRKLLRFLRAPFYLFKILFLRRNSYDLIHLHLHSWFGIFIIICARILGKPVITKVPSVGSQGIATLRDERLGAIKLALLLTSDALVSMSQTSYSEIRSAGFPSHRILTTPNGICVEDYPHIDEHGKCAKSCKVVFVGRLEKSKMVATLLHAWQEVLSSTSSPAHLEIWGAGPLERELKELSQQLGISYAVSFEGHVIGVRERLPTMDIFVLPSRNEGNSNAILEAMAAGLPIVSTPVGGTPMQVGPWGADLLVEPGDAHGLALKILKLIEDPVLRARLGQLMRQRVEEHFDIRAVARTYAAAYECLAAGERGRICQVSNPIIQLDS